MKSLDSLAVYINKGTSLQLLTNKCVCVCSLSLSLSLSAILQRIYSIRIYLLCGCEWGHGIAPVSSARRLTEIHILIYIYTIPQISGQKKKNNNNNKCGGLRWHTVGKTPTSSRQTSSSGGRYGSSIHTPAPKKSVRRSRRPVANSPPTAISLRPTATSSGASRFNLLAN